MKKIIRREFIPYWKFFVLLFLAGFVLGTVFVNVAYRNRGQDVAALQLFSLETVGNGTLDYEKYFFFLLPGRLGGMAAVQVIGATVLGPALVIAGLLAQGFLCGTFLGTALLQNGVKGMLLFLAALFPQCLLYIPAVLGMFTVISVMAGQVVQKGRFFGKGALRYCLWCLLFFTVTLWGVLVECYVNPAVLEWLLKI